MTTTTTDLAAFLLARIADDEAAAQARAHNGGCCSGCEHTCDAESARVLAQCEAQRAVVALHGGGVDPCDAHDASFRTVPCDTLRTLALPFADHEDYDPSWGAS